MEINNGIKINDIDIKWLGHASFLIKVKNKNIFIDPFRLRINEKADYVLITHSHYDHCSVEDLRKILKDNTIIVCPADCSSKITRLNMPKITIKIVEPLNRLNLTDFVLETIPAYNINKNFHERINNWVGYIIRVGKISIYHSGDTDLIPEMSKLKDITVALLPVGGTYTMNADEAARAVSIIQPSLAVPMHYGTIVGTIKDAMKFKELVGDKAVILKKYSN